MRVAYVVSRYPSSSETFVLRELNALEEDPRFEISLLSLFPPHDRLTHESGRRWLDRGRRPGPLQASAAVVRWMLRRPRPVLALVSELFRACRTSPARLGRSLVAAAVGAAHAERLRDQPVDHVHAHFATYPALAAWVVRRLVGTGYSFTAHAHDLFVDDRLLRLCLPEASFVVTISEFNRGFIEQRVTLTRPLQVIRCGIEPSAYPFRPRAVPDRGPVRALCVASLQEHKGHEVLLRALASGGADVDRIEIDLVGSGPLRSELESLAGSLGISERVNFLGALSEDRVAALLDEADLFVLPSRVAADGQMEGLPVALMEAAACGLPIVASRLSGIPELIFDGVNGYLADPGDADSLRDALERSLQGGELDLVASRARIEQDFAVRNSARRLAELFLAQGSPAAEPSA